LWGIILSFNLKKTLIIFCLIIFSFFAIKITFLNIASDSSCAFCDDNILSKQVFYQDDFVMGLCSHKPINPGHCLVIPKRHITRFEELNVDEIVSTANLIKKINKVVQKVFGDSIYIILQKNGKGLQSVPHVHFHYIPEKGEGNFFSSINYFWKFFIEVFKRPISDEKLAFNVENMRKEIVNVEI